MLRRHNNIRYGVNQPVITNQKVKHSALYRKLGKISSVCSLAVATGIPVHTSEPSAPTDVQASDESFRTSETSQSATGTSEDRNMTKDFLNPQQLLQHIHNYGQDAFMRKFGNYIFNDPEVEKLINSMSENKVDIKAILTDLLSKDESVIAKPIEISNIDVEYRQHRQDNCVEPGKTGIVVLLFKGLLDKIYGKECLERALEEGKKERKFRDRLRVQGFKTADISPEQKKAIMDLTFAKNKQFKGLEFDPENRTQWPNMEFLDAAPLLLKQKLQGIVNKNSTD